MRQMVLLTACLLIAAAPTAMAQPTFTTESSTWDYLYDEGPIEGAGEYVRDEAKDAGDDPAGYATLDQVDEFESQAMRHACWGGHYAIGHYDSLGLTSGCNGHMTYHDTQKSMEITRLGKAVGEDGDKVADYLGAWADFTVQTILDFIFGG